MSQRKILEITWRAKIWGSENRGLKGLKGEGKDISVIRIVKCMNVFMGRSIGLRRVKCMNVFVVRSVCLAIVKWMNV